MPASFPVQITPFIGREAEITHLLTLLEQPDSRLITILGLGGVGKTRLALAAAESYTRQCGIPSYFVSLEAPLSHEQVSITIANAIGFSLYGDEDVQTQLLDWMRDRQFLLVLDNFEYAQDGAGFMMKLLTAAPAVPFLVTSRERLNLRGETAFSLSGFNITPAEHSGSDSGNDAIHLFLSAARRVRTGYEPSDIALSYLHRICQLVEGLPLAIELAAAWVDTLSVKEIGDEIEASYTFLSVDFQDVPERHRSMMATFESSWKRLPDEAQDSLMRLSVFRGGFTRPAALAVANAKPRMLQVLVNRSMLSYTGDERYTIHELLRQYLRDKLESSGKAADAEAAHSGYFLDELRMVEPLIKGKDQRAASERIENDFTNVRLAWETALTARDMDALDGAVESWFWFCMMRNHYPEGESLLEQTWREAEINDAPLLVARARLRRYWIERWRRGSFSDPEAIMPQVEAALRLFQQSRQPHDEAVALLILGDISRFSDEHAHSASRLLSASLERFRALGDDFYAAWALHFLGRHALSSEGLARAIQLQQESLDLRERCGDLNGVLYAQFNLCDYFMQMGDFERSVELNRKMLERSRELGERSNELMATVLLSLIAFLSVDLSSAADLSAQAFAAASRLNHPLGRIYAMLVESLIALVKHEPESALERLRPLESSELSGIVRYLFNLASAMGLVSGEDITTAGKSIRSALLYAVAVQGAGVMAWCLPVYAIILSRENDPAQVAALVALADRTGLTRWADSWDMFAKLRVSLEATLGAQRYDAAMDEGERLDLAATAEALLHDGEAHLGANPLFSRQVINANRALHEPLSDRELEVLAWITRGLQNAEIADRLVVELSTIKKHVSHVYGKLGVTTRAQAILKAQELGLV